MFKINLIDNEYIHAFNLFDLLLINDGEQVSKAVIMESLGVSEYRLSKIYSDMLGHLSESYENNSYTIYEDKETIGLSSKRGLSRNVFINCLLLKSNKYNIFIRIGMNQFTINDYSDQFFISSSKVYKELGSLKEVLKPHNIKIDKQNKLVGDESVIRYLLIETSRQINSTDSAPYRSELLAIVKRHYTEDISYNLIHNITVYIELIKSRRAYSTEAHLNLDTIPIKLVNQDIVQELSSFVYDNVRITREGAAIEGHLLAGYIHVNLGLVSNEELSASFPQSVADEFLSKLKHDLPSISSRVFKKIEMDTNRIISKAAYIISPEFDSYIDKDVSFYEELFPEFFYFVKNVITESTHYFYKGKRHYMFYHLLLSLIVHLDAKELLDDIIICIDFNEDINYFEMIKLNIESLSSVRIKVTSEYSREADLLITDTPELYNATGITKLVWKSPPGASEWKILGDHVVHIRNKNFLTMQS